MRNIAVACAVSLILAGCGGGGGSTPSSDGRSSTQSVPTTTVQINTSNKEVLRGDSITVTWSSTNASSCTASGDWSGSKSTSGTETVTASKDSNTFTIVCNNATASTTVATVLYQLTAITSDLPNYANNITSKDELVNGLNRAVSSTTFITGQDGKMHIFMFPSLFKTGPNMPAFELLESAGNKFTLAKFHENVRLGFGRDYAQVNKSSTTKKQFVIVDQGLENTPDYTLLPHGDVWVATDTGSGFTFQTVSTNKAFYHTVATGDVNGDNKDDILVVNMGSNDPNAKKETLYSYQQNDNGSFVLDSKFAPETYPSSLSAVGSGSVSVADLDNDGNNEVIQGNYTNRFNPNWGAFRIFKKDYTGTFKVVKTYQRTGNFANMGAYKSYTVDIDNDGDLDLIFALEGNPNGDPTTYTANAIEIYRNDGNLIFTRVTDVLLTKSVYDSDKDMYWRELSITDINNDGYVDIFLQQGGFNHYLTNTNVDIGSMILKNDNGKGFVSMAGTNGLTVSFPSIRDIPDSFRIMDKKNNSTRIFGFSPSGVPTTIELRVGK
jgi:hypothetical protein